jgi:hypothetical protein
MTISMHSASVPVFTRMLGNMLGWLDKAEAHAAARKFDPNNYLGLRLAPDMLPLTRQVQIACDSAKGCVARLAGVENPRFEDSEASLADLRARIEKTLAFVRGFTPEQIDGSEDKPIEVPTRTEPMKFTGEPYLKHFALPNFYFHATTLYALLRHAGVDVGKTDYLGAR